MNSLPVAPLPWQLCLLAWICGLVGASHPWSACLACVLAACAFARPHGAMCMAVCFGLGLALSCAQDAAGIGEGWNGEAWNGNVRVRGVVREVRTYPGRRYTMLVSDVVDADTHQRLSGLLAWTWTDPPEAPVKGSVFTARLRIRELRGRHNFGLSSTEDYWARLHVRHRAYSRGYVHVSWEEWKPGLRRRIMDRVAGLVPQGQGGAVVLALLFGDRAALDPEFVDRIRRAGLAHSLALSGMHLAMAAGIGFLLAGVAGRFRPELLLVLPRQKLGILLALPPVVAYLWLGGFTASLTRAAVMLATLVLHMLRGTRSLPQDALFVAVAVLVLPDPRAVHDLGLQLSVLAVAGIVLFVPLATLHLEPLRRRNAFCRVLHFFLALAAATLCANLFILPVQALYFSEMSGQLWLNLLWLPVLSLAVMPLAFLGLALSFMPDCAAQSCFTLAAMGVEWLDRGLVALDGAGLLDALAVLRPRELEVLGYWTVLLSGAAMVGRARPPVRGLVFLGTGLALMAVPQIWQEAAAMRPAIALTVLDTGMSQAVSIRSSTGATILVDGAGGWSPDYDPGRALVAPALSWGHPPRLDGVVVTHMDSDHSRGLFYLLEAFDVGWFAWSGLLDYGPDSRRLRKLLARELWPVRRVRAGDRLVIEPGLWLDVLHPGPEERGLSCNENSLVLRLVWRGRGLALLTGDAEQRALDDILGSGVDLTADVLVLPHHGSRSSLRDDLYERVQARWAVAACGPGNRYGFPHEDVVRACAASGARVMTTARHGAVRFFWEKDAPVEIRCARFRCAEAGSGALCPEDLCCMPRFETNNPRSGQ